MSKKKKGSSCHASVVQWLTNPTRNHEVAGSIPGLAQQVEDLALLWLWRRPVATALIRPLVWEPPYASGAALEKTKKKKKRGQVGTFKSYIPLSFIPGGGGAGGRATFTLTAEEACSIWRTGLRQASGQDRTLFPKTGSQ